MPGDAGQQLFAVHRLEQEIHGAGMGGAHRVGHIAVRGEDGHRQLGVALLDAAKQFQAIHAGHAQVGEDELRPQRLEPGQGLVAGSGGDDAVALGFQPQGQHAQQLVVVVDQQDVVGSHVGISVRGCRDRARC